MSGCGEHKIVLVRMGTVILILAAIAAWCSNPDEASFRRWFTDQFETRTDSPMEAVAQQLLPEALLTVSQCERTNYGFFSVVEFDGPVKGTFVGVYGKWIPVSERGGK